MNETIKELINLLMNECYIRQANDRLQITFAFSNLLIKI